MNSIGSAMMFGSATTSLAIELSGNRNELIIVAAKNAKSVKKDVGFLEELMTIYMTSTDEPLPALDLDQKMMRYS